MCGYMITGFISFVLGFMLCAILFANKYDEVSSHTLPEPEREDDDE